MTLKTLCCFILISITTVLWAQDWNEVHLKKMTTDDAGDIHLETAANIGGAWQRFQAADFQRRLLIDADFWLGGSPEENEVFYWFGDDSSGALPGYAAGYSLVNERIFLAAVRQDSLGIHLKMLDEKSVEIHDTREKYVFRLIVWANSQRITFEVNGVPMESELDKDFSEIRQFGFLLKGTSVRIEPLRLKAE